MWIRPRSADSAESVVAPEVHARVLLEGQARVIVEMRLSGGPFVEEGGLAAAGVRAQQADIAVTRLQILSRLAGRSHRELRQYGTVPLLSLEIGPDALAELEASSSWVKRVVEDRLHAPSLPQSVPLIGGNKAWSLGSDGTGMVVAILDTGVQATHPFLADKVVEEACYSTTISGYSVSLCPNGSDEQTGPGSAVNCSLSDCFHGTHVAGIAAGNGTGAGVPFSGVAKGAQIMAVQVYSKINNASDCNSFGFLSPCILTFTSDIIAGLERVYSLREVRSFAAANLSLGGSVHTAPCDDDPTKPIIDNLRSVGIATVIASGNDGYTNAIESPACISSAISVGATTKEDVVASYSNVASFLSLFAPGGIPPSAAEKIYSSVPPSQFDYKDGTSMSAPHVTGAWAVLKQAAPSASVAQILSYLQTTGVPITDTSSTGTVTKPRIQVDQALTVLLSGACVASSTTMCLNNNAGDQRFGVTASFHTTQGGGSSGNAGAIPAAPLGVTQGGLFWFFESTNPELLVKILPKCSVNGHFWVFASAGTNVGVTITVTDTFTAAQRVYTNPDITPMAPIQDITAFSCP